jgi:hypothetical protein
MNLEEEILIIKERNLRVEAEKAWEVSNARKVLLILITYVMAYLLMLVIGVDKPYINALIPTMGFFLSTLSLRFVKAYWIKKNISNSK